MFYLGFFILHLSIHMLVSKNISISNDVHVL